MQRVRIGLTGLASVFLLVVFAAAFFGLASNETVIDTDAAGNVVEVRPLDPVANMGQPAEPLAELGVAPGGGPTDPEPATDTPATAN